MEPSNWAPEHSGALQEYLALGMTYSRVGQWQQAEQRFRRSVV